MKNENSKNITIIVYFILLKGSLNDGNIIILKVLYFEYNFKFKRDIYG